MDDEIALIILGGTPPPTIALQTRKGADVENEQAPSPSADNLRVIGRLEAQYAGRWAKRCDARGIYNCAGHVWATRRTAVYETPEWNRILQDDDYTEIGQNEIAVGDLVLYSWNGRFLHVAQVIQINMLGEAKIPVLLSKFSDFSGEYVHGLRDVDLPQFPDYQIHFFTERL